MNDTEWYKLYFRFRNGRLAPSVYVKCRHDEVSAIAQKVKYPLYGAIFNGHYECENPLGNIALVADNQGGVSKQTWRYVK